MLGRDKVLVALQSKQGLNTSCADVRLIQEDRELRIDNSYCPLTFSRAATAYKNKVAEFQDHRAFFKAAPRYALIVGLTVLMPVLAMWIWPNYPVAAAGAALLAAGGLAVATFIVMETIGAVEYDKEHQAQELRARHGALTQAHSEIQKDLERARRIQRMLIPDDHAQPLPEHCRLAYRFVPEMAVGGDYFDVRANGGEELALLLADVSGHGMSGAFITGLIKTAFELAYDPVEAPHRFMEVLNRLLERNTPADSFAAIMFVVYDAYHQRLRYVVAGHAPVPFLVRKNGDIEALDQSGGLITGVQEDASYVYEQVDVHPGDLLVMCTDGITDAANAVGEFFGRRALEELLRSQAGSSAREVVQAIDAALREHVRNAAQTDDQTVIAMQVL
jgi:serine phosphatase RsbU (regulator of sigma subunit)